jgi:hypothetical protein
MYGKKFIAGLIFLAVVHVRAQNEEETDMDLYEAAPEPDI